MSLKNHSSFKALTGAQLLGAFNDNVFRQFILLIAARVTVEWLPIDPQAAVMAVFALPFVLFAVLGGSIADRFPKRRVIVIAKAVEILAMALGMAAFALQEIHPDLSIIAMLTVLFLMGTQSAFFGPSKYGILPEMVSEKDLTRANGIINMTTNVATILGVVVAGALFTYLHPTDDLKSGHPNWWSGFFFISVALIGWLISRKIARGKSAADPQRNLNWNPVSGIAEIKHLFGDRPLFGAVIATSWFFLIGALALSVLNEFGRVVLQLPGDGSSLFFFVAGGIALGSLLASRLSGDHIEIGIVPIGGFMMTVGFGLVPYVDETLPSVGAALALAGIGGGLFLVPLASYVQDRAQGKEKGRIQGAQELLTFLFIFGSALVFEMIQNERLLGLDPQGAILVLATLSLIGTLGVFLAVPHISVRFPVWLIVHLFYRITVIGSKNIPRRGGALIVANHLSYADPFLVGSAVPRFIHFLAHRQFSGKSLIGFATGLMRAIPVSSEDGPRSILRSLDEAARLAKKGHLVCIFAEGGISRTGNLLPFSKGLERIASKGEVPIIPIYLDRVWGSIFSFRGKRFFFKRPLRIPYPITVAIGEPLKSTASAMQVRQAVQELSALALDSRKQEGLTLATRFLTSARKAPRRIAAIELDKSISYRKFLILVLILRRKLRHRLADQTHIGLLLPAGIGGASSNIAVAVMGKVATNLNFTAGTDALASACQQTGLKTIITANIFLKKIDLDLSKIAPDVEVIDLPSLLAREVTKKDKVVAMLTALLPSFFLNRLAGVPHDPDADASIMFSSGSTGTPKGIRLTHHNILSNVRSVSQVFDVDSKDRVVGSLPFFHVFGFTITLWFPLANAIGAIYHPNPMDTDALATLIRENKGTIFLSTPTFYRTYLRKFDPVDFASVRLAGAGAEKLKASLAEAWEERFGCALLEGYGCTELSPVVSVNLPDLTDSPIRQKTRKFGSIGMPVPGVVTKIVDPDTLEERPIGETGLLLIKGPNVMKGYLGRDDLTEEAFHGEWYKTGDIAMMDSDGFLSITDRLSRFSKLGGEMVPHILIEEHLQEIVDNYFKGNPDTEAPPQLAVTAIPDDAKGEKLVVLHGKLPIEPAQIIEELRSQKTLPNLWIPRSDSFIEVEGIPTLGTGKVDLRAVKQLALDSLG
ncbi:MAG: MFS transporter [Planctomycetes bacterium]|nr:MFS transporter [Planctomycetota bacterium]MBT6453617.1 MFS transporter [Planctomycetota bacterium]MBT6540532.1 MFS transporter [Planctomycetota bacterium]MBT6968399.1 MFS transporter [Planctomycetota bacterium]MBT7105153.1 MFS transporter [Planctomycetota bacterium]